MSIHQPYIDKAQESLVGARSELANRPYNNAANRLYYAAYQAAVAALLSAGLRRTEWSHEDVRASFAGELISTQEAVSLEQEGWTHSAKIDLRLARGRRFVANQEA